MNLDFNTKLFKKEKMTLAIIGPYKSDKQFKKLLNF